MTDQEMILKYAQNEEERLLGRRLLDLYDLSQRSGQNMYTGFLTKSEQCYLMLTCPSIHINIDFYGGYEGSERCVAVIFPDKKEELIDSEKENILAAISITHHEKLSHRDFLGAALGLGIKRQTIGDILVGDTESILFVSRNMAPFFLENFNKAGRVLLSCREIPTRSIKAVEPTFKIINDTIASNRLDSIVASGFSLSREIVKKAIERELISVNHRINTSSTSLLKEGDIVSMRGQGKFILSSIGGMSKKGRTWIEIKRYV